MKSSFDGFMVYINSMLVFYLYHVFCKYHVRVIKFIALKFKFECFCTAWFEKEDIEVEPC